MAQYRVFITLNTSIYVEVGATSADEAEDRARGLIEDGQVVFDNGDYTYTAELVTDAPALGFGILKFGGVEHLTRTLLIEQEGGGQMEVMVATELLQTALMASDSEEARQIDDTIFYYLPPPDFMLPDAALAALLREV